VVPVEGAAESLELILHLCDVLLCPGCGLYSPLIGGILGGQTKGIPAHRLEHVLAAHSLEASHRIGNGVDAHMAHVEIARGVWEHGEHVVLFLRFLRVELPTTELLPPVGLNPVLNIVS